MRQPRTYHDKLILKTCKQLTGCTVGHFGQDDEILHRGGVNVQCLCLAVQHE